MGEGARESWSGGGMWWWAVSQPVALSAAQGSEVCTKDGWTWGCRRCRASEVCLCRRAGPGCCGVQVAVWERVEGDTLV